MRVLYKMIREFLPSLPGPEDLRHIFPRVGLEVEGYRDLSEGLRGKLIAGIVKKIERDSRLNLMEVFVGDGIINAITTSPVESGETVILALPGATLPSGMTIEKRVIRGHPSEAMAISEEEVGLAESSSTILRLPEGILRPGDDPIAYLCLDDWLFDLYIFPNRGDLMGAWGIACELAPIVGERPRIPDPEVSEDPSIEAYPVELADPESCPRYVARVIRSTSVTRSPAWLRHRLALLGQRPINNIVDASNYVLFWLGHPTHTFDLSELSGRIVVRRAQDGETMAMLDETKRSFDAEMLLIADEKRGLALAGVMGGEGSGVSDATEDVLIESAYFNPQRIAYASRKTGMITESSRRFERGADPLMAPIASRWVARLIQETGGGRIGPENDARARDFSRKGLTVSLAWLKRFSGADIPLEETIRITDALDLNPVVEGDSLRLEIPPRRHDLSIKEDIAEEIIRFWGYERLPDDAPTISRTRGFSGQSHLDGLALALSGSGLYEARTLGLHGPRELSLWGFDPERWVRISNPIGEDFSVARPSLLPGLVRSLALNLNRGRGGLMLFEIGGVFSWRGDNELPDEAQLLGIVGGGEFPRTPFSAEEEIGPAHLKGVLDLVFGFLGREYSMARAQRPYLVPGTAWEIIHDRETLGVAGLLREEIASFYEIKHDIWLAELSVPEPTESLYRPIPRFPPVKRDIAFIADEDIPFQEVFSAVRDAARCEVPVVVRPIDVYRGQNIPEGKVSYAFSLAYYHPERTLTDQEVDVWFSSLMKKLSEEGYHIREKRHAG
ncbi:MAG: phenylalanine--tRNA ligase subunit beta [candidate division WOR-3 bacterium]